MRIRSLAMRFLIWFFLFLLLLLLFGHIRGNAVSQLPFGVEYSSSEPTVSFSEIKSAQTGIENATISAETAADGTAGIADSPLTNRARLVFTDGNYLNFHREMTLVRGSFFRENLAENTAVVSSSFANDLFKTLDVVGRQIDVNGKTLTITGVYESDRSLLSCVSSSGDPDILLPWAISLGEKPEYAQILYFSGSGEDKTSFEAWLDNKTKLYEQIDYTKAIALLDQQQAVLLFLLGTIVLLFLAVWFVRELRLLLRWWGHTRREYEEFTIQGWMLRLWKPMLALALFAITAVWILFEPYIPADVMPDSSKFFSFNYYFELLISDIQNRNGRAIHLYFDALSASSFALTSFLIPLLGVFFALTVRTGRKLTKSAWISWKGESDAD